jgi:cysteine-rich repeat protein
VWWLLFVLVGIWVRKRFLLFVMLCLSCSEPKSGDEVRGVEGAPCFADGTCHAGLLCIEAICSPPEGSRDADSDAGLESDAGTGDAEPDDAAPEDAEGSDRYDAELPDSETQEAGSDGGVGCGNMQLDPGEECDDGNAGVGDGCTPSCELELRIDSLSTSACTVVNDYGGTAGTLLGIGLTTTHLLSATDSRTWAFLRPNLTGVQEVPNGARFNEMFSDLRTQTVYALADGGFPISGYYAMADGMLEVTATGPVGLIPLSLPIELSNESYRFSGRGFVIVLTHQVEVGTANGYRIELPSGVVTDLGIMPAFGTHDECESAGGIAENFGGSTYLVAPDSSISPMRVIRRHRIPDGATSVVAEFSDLGYLCNFTIDPVLGRWYFDWYGPSQLGGVARSVAHCDALFQPGGDGVVPFPGIRKGPIPQDTWYGYGLFTSSQSGATAIANSFVAPMQNTRPISLGAWIVNGGTSARPNISLQIWGSTPNATPDVNQVLAMTPFFTATNATVTTYFEFPVIAGGAPLTPGTRYWFVATTLGGSQPPELGIDRFPRHNQNSDGLVDDGVFMYSYDPIGIAFEPNTGARWAELAFTVTLGP